MNEIPNPYRPPTLPRIRPAVRRLLILTLLCAVALLVVITLTGCNPPEGSLTTPQDSTPPANPGVGAVPASTLPPSAHTGAHSA